MWRTSSRFKLSMTTRMWVLLTPNGFTISRKRREHQRQSSRTNAPFVGCIVVLCGAFDEHLRPAKDTGPLIQPLQPTFATDQVLVVPLDFSRLGQPALQLLCVNLVGGGVPHFSGFEAPFLFQTFLFKGLTAPEEQPYAVFQLAVSDDGVAIEKPYRMGVPYLVGLNRCRGREVGERFGWGRRFLSEGQWCYR